MTLCLYEMDSIGAGGAMEAVAVKWFCSDKCRRIYETDVPVEAGEDDEWIDGTVCDECGTPLTRT